MSLKLNTASGGSITLQEADTASNLTLTVPAQAGTIVTANSSGNVGIGTASPNTPLSIVANHVSGQGTAKIQTVTSFASGGLSSISLNDSDGSRKGFIFQDTSGLTVEAIGTAPVNLTSNGAVQLRVNSSGNLLFNSGYGSTATAYGCRAWVNFNGTGTPAIRASGNVSSITDNGTGDYTVNFATAMPDANYSLQLSVGTSASGEYASQISIFSQTNSPFEQAPTTTTARFVTRNTSFTFTDPKYLCVSVFR
jgi:hypothetical protein